jgi:type 1 glutamine amidotransferase
VLGLGATAACTAALGLSSAAAPASGPAWRILVFTKTAEFRHDSIPAAIAAVQSLGAANGFAVDQTEDGGAFTDPNLARYRVVMFLLTTGDVLDDAEQAALQRYIEAGGGFVGVHSAADTEHDWPWYGGLVGAYFASHPAIQTATIDVADPRGPGTVGLPAQWVRTDEWYNFASDPRPSVHVLATLDESTYNPGDGAMGADHPIAWYHDYDGGRAWYTALGHTDSTYSEPLFLSHLLSGILYAAGPGPAAAAPPRILALAASVTRSRVTVAVRIGSCSSCSAQARFTLRGRTVVTPLRRAGATARGTTPSLPGGRWPLVVTVTDSSTGLSATARRSVRVPPS